MTISSTTTKVSYAGNGSTTVFAYTFKVFAAGDLQVIIRSSTGTETTQTLTTHYTISGVGTDGGGNVTFVTAPASGETVVLRRNVTLTQGTDYVENDPFPANSHENALDRLTMITQGIQEELDRAIKASVTNTISSTEFTVSAADRANKLFAFDDAGDLSVTQEIGDYQGDWAAATDYYSRDIVKDTSNNNIYICNTIHTSSGSLPLTSNADSAKWDLLVDAASATSSASAAASSATAAAASATAAAASAASAATSESNASSSSTSANTAKVAAEAAQSAAETAQTGAETAETNSAASATAAASSASSASTSASSASSSATSASSSATSATASAAAASTSETNSAASAATATTKAGEASTSASNAATSASNASTSETNAAASATAAQTAQTAAEAALDAFDDNYLGAKASDPTVDNDGDALTSGDLYFNTTSNELKVWNGTNWIAITIPTITAVSSQTNTATDYLDIPSGTTAQRPGSPTTGNIRFNTTESEYEAWDGSAWSPIGGGSSTTDGIWQHANTIVEDYEILSGNNGLSAAPVTVASGVTVTIPSGSVWTLV